MHLAVLVWEMVGEKKNNRRDKYAGTDTELV